MRRIIVVEPMSRSAIWSKRMALMALAVTSIALLLTRSRQIELDAGMVAILGGLGFAVLALILALMAFARIWSEGRRGLRSVPDRIRARLDASWHCRPIWAACVCMPRNHGI